MLMTNESLQALKNVEKQILSFQDGTLEKPSEKQSVEEENITIRNSHTNS